MSTKKKQKRPSTKINIQALEPWKWTEEMDKAIKKALNNHFEEMERKQDEYLAEPVVDIPEPEVFLKSRTPVRDYLRIAAIVLGAAFLGNLALQKMSGPPQAARYQINHGPLQVWTDYAHHKPSLTPSGCVIWFDLKGDGNIFCGEFVIANIPGRIPKPSKK